MATPSTGKQADPEFRRERAAKAGRAAHSLGVHVRAIVARAPELTDEHRRALAVALVEGMAPCDPRAIEVAHAIRDPSR